MKHLLTFLLLLTGITAGFCQIPFSDALALKRELNVAGEWEDEDPEVTAILSKYTNGQIKTVFRDDNPFTAPYMASWGNSGNDPGRIISGFGATDVTSLADGLGKFLAERTKEEINIAFFEKLKLLLGQYPELGTAFPSTVKYLEVVMNHEYSNMLTTLKEAFERDLKSLPKNLIEIANLTPADCKCTGKKQENCLKRIAFLADLFKKDEGTVVIGSLVVADAILSGTSAPEIFAGLGRHPLIKDRKNNAANVLKLSAIVSNSIRNESNTDQWVTPLQLKEMIKDKVWFELYMGLVYQQIQNDDIHIGDKEIWTLLGKEKDAVKGFQTYLTRVVKDGETLNGSMQNLMRDSATAGKVGIFISDFRKFFKSATDYTVISTKIPEPGDKTKLVLYVTDQGLGITQNILVKNYSAAVLSAVFMLDSLLETGDFTTRKGAIHAGKKNREAFVNAGGTLPAVPAGETARHYLTRQYLTKLNFKRNLLRYGTFMANVILAKNSDEIKKSIQAVALPPGSASIKKNTNFSITLQAYTGFSGGREIPNLRTPASRGVFFNALSVYAPVGIAFNLGLKSHRNPSNKYNAGSLSAMLSIVDVGAVFSYRFSDPGSTLADSVKIRLENIFAPGANLVYGIPKVPLSIGTGIQWQPSLTRLSNTNATIANQSGVRWQLFLVFDLPILNLYTSRR